MSRIRMHEAAAAALSLALMLLVFMLGNRPAAAADGDYPNKPVRLVVPFPAGASSDVVGRMLGEKLAEHLGQQVVPDNRPGAGGTSA